jgi:hypothetical protein
MNEALHRTHRQLLRVNAENSSAAVNNSANRRRTRSTEEVVDSERDPAVSDQDDGHDNNSSRSSMDLTDMHLSRDSRDNNDSGTNLNKLPSNNSIANMLRDVLKYQTKSATTGPRRANADIEGIEDEEDDRYSIVDDETNAGSAHNSNTMSGGSSSGNASAKVLFSACCRVVTRACNASTPPVSGFIIVTKTKITFTTGRTVASNSASSHSASTFNLMSSGGDTGRGSFMVPSNNNRKSIDKETAFQFTGFMSSFASSNALMSPVTPKPLSSGASGFFNVTPTSTHASSSTPTSTTAAASSATAVVTAEWSTDDIYDCLRRRYNLRNVAVELFFTNRMTLFLDFDEPYDVEIFESTIRRKVKPHLMVGISDWRGSKPQQIMAHRRLETTNMTITQSWVERKISNFEYLMYVNTIAGRSYNDLGQYPIFPWVIADYASSYLDLRDPKTFRDLQWPIGAQNEEQRNTAKNRYAQLLDIYTSSNSVDMFGDDETAASNSRTCPPPFHFGSHYSVAGFVIWYMMRLEPFTSFHLQLQSGKFDKADRLFCSLKDTYFGCTTSSSDVKELIPELFYSPEMLMNVNNNNMGTTQMGKKVGDVDLPPWSKGSPHEFIRLHRKALESEYVSANLHHWIDLIFGYKQRPTYLSDGHPVSSCKPVTFVVLWAIFVCNLGCGSVLQCVLPPDVRRLRGSRGPADHKRGVIWPIYVPNSRIRPDAYPIVPQTAPTA